MAVDQALCCLCIVWAIPESHVGIVTNLGAYKETLEAGGPYCINPAFDALTNLVNLKQRQVSVYVRTKVDKAEISLTVQVQYKVENTPEGIKNSVYKLAEPTEQIVAYVQDVLRSAVSDLSVEQVFDSKDDIGKEVFESLNEKMREYGYEIMQTLVTDVVPSDSVKKSFDLNNLNRYYKEADKFAQMIKTSEKNTRSEAQKERDGILGRGISEQRQEIVNGLKGSIDAFTGEVSGVNARDVLELVLVTQYFDMLKDVGCSDNSKVIFTPGNEGATGDVRDAMLQGKLA